MILLGGCDNGAGLRQQPCNIERREWCPKRRSPRGNFHAGSAIAESAHRRLARCAINFLQHFMGMKFRRRRSSFPLRSCWRKKRHTLQIGRDRVLQRNKRKLKYRLCPTPPAPRLGPLPPIQGTKEGRKWILVRRKARTNQPNPVSSIPHTGC